MKKVDAAVENPFMSNVAAIKMKDLCWSCKQEIYEKDYFCHYCDAVLPGETKNVFETLGVKPSFDIDRNKVEKLYFSLQQRLHPDNFIGLTPLEIQFSEQHSAAVNNAYTVIKDPLQRAENLLAVNGIKIPKDKSIQDADLLMEIMEVREKLAKSNGLTEIEKIANAVEQDFNQYLNELSDEFANNNFIKACKILTRLIYLQKILDECFQKEREC